MATRQTFVSAGQPVRIVGTLQELGQGLRAVPQNGMSHIAMQKPVLTVKQQVNAVSKPSSQSGPQYIVTKLPITVAGERNGSQNVYSIQQSSSIPSVHHSAQFVNRPAQQTVYQTTNMDMSHDEGSDDYYEQVVAAGPGGISQMSSHIVNHQGTSFVIHGTGIGSENHVLSAAPRASPVTVQWLLDNYEEARGVSLPRSTVYSHYHQHCAVENIEPMNAASFGKLIRSVFPNIQTRRLGTRGNSKYHYDGVQIKQSSVLSRAPVYNNTSYRNAYPNEMFKQEVGQQVVDASNNNQANHLVTEPAISNKHQQFLGDASAAIPNFGHIDLGSESLPDGVTTECLAAYENLYLQNCETILHCVVNLEFQKIGVLWSCFWRTAQSEETDVELEMVLPKAVLYKVAAMPCVISYTRLSDLAFYQALIEVLIPDVLRPIPGSLTQVIRNFAKNLESSLQAGMQDVPVAMIDAKVSAVATFVEMLRFYTSLNHEAQASRSVLQNADQVKQMLTDLNRINFDNIQGHVNWVCCCSDTVIQEIEMSVKKNLSEQISLEQWAEWLEDVISKFLRPCEGLPDFADAARNFLLKWSYYCAAVVHDLTLRSAPSFGSFHLIRMLFDDYMRYLAAHKTAAATNKHPMAVWDSKKGSIKVPPLDEPVVSFDLSHLPAETEETLLTVIKSEPVLLTSDASDSLMTIPSSATSLPSSSLPHLTSEPVSDSVPFNSAKTVAETTNGASAAARPSTRIFVLPVKRSSTNNINLMTKRVCMN